MDWKEPYTGKTGRKTVKNQYHMSMRQRIWVGGKTLDENKQSRKVS